MFNRLVSAVRERAAQTRRPAGSFVIAISGFGGAGKSGLAARLRDALGEAEVVSIDDFVVGRLAGRSADWEGFDRGRLRAEALEPGLRGEVVEYGVYDWEADAVIGRKALGPAAFLIVEGCGLFHPDMEGAYDYRIWVDVPLEEATRRGMVRDREKGADEAWDRQWLNVWMPNERDFFAKHRPDVGVDFVYDGLAA